MLLIHANAVGAAHWDAMFTWLAAHGHRVATADAVLADETFGDLPIDPARWGYGHYTRLEKLRRQAEVRAEVAAVLDVQAAAWNRGDLEAFCALYAPDAVLASPTGLERGRAALLARYRAKYPDAASRGTLSFAIEETRLTSFSTCAVRPAESSRVAGARWTLTLRRQAAGPRAAPDRGASAPRRGLRAARWEIFQDASSSVDHSNSASGGGHRVTLGRTRDQPA